jgi:MFS transporter, MHS family, alpha-ketoglutarate permease
MTRATALVPLPSTFAVFAVGFFMRPLGGLLMGSFADRFGRKTAMTFTIVLMETKDQPLS